MAAYFRYFRSWQKMKSLLLSSNNPLFPSAYSIPVFMEMSYVQLMKCTRSLQHLAHLQKTHNYNTTPTRFLCTSNQLARGSRGPTDLVERLAPRLKTESDVIEKVNNEIADEQGRIFAIIVFNGHQFKVTPGDLLQVKEHLAADVGERIRLEKVLLIGGDNFTVIGTPLIDLNLVRVEATVIEKTVSAKAIKFRLVKRKRYKNYREFTTDMTVLRINTIEVNPKLS